MILEFFLSPTPPLLPYAFVVCGRRAPTRPKFCFLFPFPTPAPGSPALFSPGAPLLGTPLRKHQRFSRAFPSCDVLPFPSPSIISSRRLFSTDPFRRLLSPKQKDAATFFPALKAPSPDRCPFLPQSRSFFSLLGPRAFSCGLPEFQYREGASLQDCLTSFLECSNASLPGIFWLLFPSKFSLPIEALFLPS